MIQKKKRERTSFFSEVEKVCLTLKTNRGGNENGPTVSALRWANGWVDGVCVCVVVVGGGLCNERRSSVRLNWAEIQSANNAKRKKRKKIQAGRQAEQVAWGWLHSVVISGLHWPQGRAPHGWGRWANWEKYQPLEHGRWLERGYYIWWKCLLYYKYKRLRNCLLSAYWD